MTLFSRQDIGIAHNTEMQILYAMIKKFKIAPIKEIFKHWLELLKTFSTSSISCTSLITRIATGVGAMEHQEVEYILTPRLVIDENYLVQGHHLKHSAAGQLVFFFQGRTNEILLPNPDLRVYHSPALTFPLVTQEEARRSSVSSRVTRSRASNKASSS
jgi:hypothetical protein